MSFFHTASSIELLESRIAPASFLVNSLLDNGDGTHTTLREAIAEANDPVAHPGADTITFDPAVFQSILPHTILLSGPIPINGALTIKGPGVDALAISGQDAVRIFFIDDGNGDLLSPTTISNLSLIDGGGGTNGGALNTVEPLTLVNVVVASSSVNSSGGGIYVDTPGKVSITHGKFFDNQAPVTAGGLFVAAKGGITISQTTVESNSTNANTGLGGGMVLSSSGAIVIKDSSIIGNASSAYGGLLMDDGKLSISNTVFRENSAHIGGALGTAGGTISVTLTKTLFSDNFATDTGGAIYFAGAPGPLKIVGSLFLHNSASNDGGAIIIETAASAVSISKSTFTGNNAKDGGAISLAAGAPLTVAGSVFSQNHATSKGGAIYAGAGGSLKIAGSHFLTNLADLGGGAMATNSSVVTVSVSGSIFQANATQHGGALYSLAGDWTIKSSQFLSNVALNGGAFELQTSPFAISGSLFRDNTANSDGGAIYTVGGNGSITSSSFFDNEAGGESGLGGALKIDSGKVALSKLKIMGNFASQGGGIYNSSADATLTASTVTGNFARTDSNKHGF